MLTVYLPLGPLKIFACSARTVIHLCSVLSNKLWLRRASARRQDPPDAPQPKATQLQLTYSKHTHTPTHIPLMRKWKRCQGVSKPEAPLTDNTAVSIKNGWSVKERGGCRYLATPVTLTSVGGGGGATRAARETNDSYLCWQNIPDAVNKW